MLSFSGSLKVFVTVEPCDMRRSFNRLHDLVSTRLIEDPRSSSIYAFTRPQANHPRPLPPHLRKSSEKLDPAQLELMLGGELAKKARRRRSRNPRPGG